MTAALPIVLAALAGIAAVVLAAQLAAVSPKVWIFIVSSAALAAVGVRSREPKLLLLFAWLFVLTYNRQYFSFGRLFGDDGSAGLYWVVGDMFFGLLLLGWVAEATFLRRTGIARGRAVWPWYLPFAAVCAFSALGAEHGDWVFFDLVRVLKVALILSYFRHNVGKREWWSCIAGFGCAMTAQSALGILEVVSKRSGVLWVFGLQNRMDAVPDMYKSVEFYGWVRATATMAHPPNLACYLLLTIPLFVALSLTVERPIGRAASGIAALIGLIGLACTLSRFPWALAAAELSLLVTGLVILRLLPIGRAAGLVVVAALVLVATALPFAELISDRMTRDFTRSVDHRKRENEVALAMASDHPILGVGLNNYRAHLVEYGSELAWALDEEEIATKELNVRYIAGPLNAFLLVLAETGILGMMTFVVYLLGVARIGFGAIGSTRGPIRAACLALVIGLGAVIVQQAIDYSYWIDPILYTFTAQVGLLNVAASVFASKG